MTAFPHPPLTLSLSPGYGGEGTGKLAATRVCQNFNYQWRRQGEETRKLAATIERFVGTTHQMFYLQLLLGIVAALLLSTSATFAAPPTPPLWDTFADTWVATDGLGRALPSSEQVGVPKKKRFVGLFYFLWLDGQTPVRDLSKLLKENPLAPDFGPPGSFHFWGQPLFGYYRSDDRYVIRKHVQMLADAGVDVLFFDVTNGPTYDTAARAVCEVIAEMRALGQTTPGIAYIAHARPEQVVGRLYDTLYVKDLYADLWFRWKGKPLILCPPEGIPERAKNFFTVRNSWAWSSGKWFGDGKDAWPWLDHTPQKAGWHESPNRAEEISVAVAEHPVSNMGRSFHGGHEPKADQLATDRGLYFAEQWKRALEVDPELVFVTGWNEWVAQRFLNTDKTQLAGKKLAKGDSYFVDQYSQELSRDIEPMAGGHGDAYYYQLVENIRRYKGVRPVVPVVSQPIAIDGTFLDWQKVSPEFRDTLGDPARRDHPGWKNEPAFTNQTGRNDIVVAKCAWDSKNVYFYVRTKDALSASTDLNWMLLYIDVDHNPATGWLGYDLVINRGPVKAGITTAQKHVGPGYIWGPAIDISYAAKGNELELVIPRTLLSAATGVAKGAGVTLDFKWADNIQQTGQASDFTINGDVAPNDRFNYRAILGK